MQSEPPTAPPPPKSCCSGVNGSHTVLCDHTSDILTDTHICWQCGKEVPRDYTMLWSSLGCRCMSHEGLPVPAEFRSIVEYPTVEDVIARDRREGD